MLHLPHYAVFFEHTLTVGGSQARLNARTEFEISQRSLKEGGGSWSCNALQRVSPLEFFHTETAGDSFASRASEAKRVSVATWRIRMVLAARATWNRNPKNPVATERGSCIASTLCY